MATVFPTVPSTRSFPRHRVQKLLNRSQYKGLSTKVEAEAVFIQLAEDGFPVRQVFLAVTEKEFFIVKQEIPETVHVSPTNDTEISDLAIDQILPLPLIRFLILDDSTNFFSISTFSGARYWFEMCQLDLEPEKLWGKWRKTILRFGGDVNKWRSSYVIELRHEFETQPELTRTKVKTANSKSLCGVLSFNSVGIQTEKDLISNKHDPDLEDIPSRDKMVKYTTRPKTRPNAIGNDNAERAKRSRETKGARETLQENDSTSSSSSDYSLDGPWIGYRPSDRLDTLFTEAKFEPCSESDSYGVMQLKLRKSRSLSDLLDSQCQPCDMPDTDSSLLKKLSKARQNVLSCKNKRSIDLESSSESDDDDLDKLFEEAENKMERNEENGRSGRELWGLVRESVVQKRKTSILERFQNVVHRVHFRTLSNRHVSLAQSITEFDPIDVSSQFTSISRKLFLALSPRDLDIFTRSRGKEILRALERILKFSEDIRKMVVTEIIKPDSRPGSVSVLKFFVQVGLNLLFRHHDFHSLMAVLRGLTSLPLYRLNNMWATFFVQESFSFCHFLTMIQLLSARKGHAAYVSRVNTCIKRKSAFIPQLDHILRHCLKISNSKTESLNLANSRHEKGEKFKKNKSVRARSDSVKMLERNDKEKILNIPDKISKRRKSNSIMSMLKLVRRDSDLTDSLPEKKESISKQKKTNSFLKPVLVRKEKGRNSLTNILFGGKKNKKKHRVTFQLDCDIEGGKVKERSNKLLKHLTKTRVTHTDKPYRGDSETENDSSSDEGDDKTSGTNIGGNIEIPLSSLTSMYVKFTRSPVLMQFCDFKAKNILDSALQEVARRELIENDDMSADSENDSSEESESSLTDTFHRNDETLDDDVTHEIDKIFHHKGITDETETEEKSYSYTANFQNIPDYEFSELFENKEQTDENEFSRRSSLNLQQEHHVEDKTIENVIEDTIIEDRGHKTLQEESFKAKKSKKGKVKQKLSKLKKRPLFLKKIMDKFGKSRKADIKHIKALQKDIDDIADIMSSFKTFADDHVTTKDTNIEANLLNGSNGESETDINTAKLPGTSRRKSYVPGIVERGRRKSMFEEALPANSNEEEEKEAELFESLKNMRLDGLKKRGSIAFDLLTPDEDDSLDESDLIDNFSKSSSIESFTSLFKGNNKSSNSSPDSGNNGHLEIFKKYIKISPKRVCLELGPDISRERESKSLRGENCPKPWKVSFRTTQDDHNQNSSDTTFDVVSIDVIQSVRNKDKGFAYDSSHRECSLCGNKVCLYESGIGNHVINAQTKLVKFEIPSRQRVKECIRSIITINNYLSDFDILQLSLYSE